MTPFAMRATMLGQAFACHGPAMAASFHGMLPRRDEVHVHFGDRVPLET